MHRAGLTIWWLVLVGLRTPQRRGSTGKYDAQEGERGEEASPIADSLPANCSGSVV